MVKKSLAQTYQKKTDRQHILDNPDTYIGSVEEDTITDWFLRDDNKMVRKSFKWVEGLFKCFDEISFYKWLFYNGLHLSDTLDIYTKENDRNPSISNLFEFITTILVEKIWIRLKFLLGNDPSLSDEIFSKKNHAWAEIILNKIEK